MTTIAREIETSAEAPRETIELIQTTFGVFAQQLSVLLHQESPRSGLVKMIASAILS